MSMWTILRIGTRHQGDRIVARPASARTGGGRARNIRLHRDAHKMTIPPMSATKTLALIGASEETAAHIRLLMKLGARQLQHEWRWGELEQADFVAVEIHDLGCQGVVARCQAAGVPCAVMAEANEVVVHGLVLRRPFKMDQIVAVLNAAGADSADAGEVEAFADDFYTRDLDDTSGASGRSQSEDLWTRREKPQAGAKPADGGPATDLETHIHGDPLVEPEAPKPLIQGDTRLEKAYGERTLRSEGRAAQSRHRVPAGVVGVETVDVDPIVIPPRQDGTMASPMSAPRPGESDGSGLRLDDYLDGSAIATPSQLQLPDAPALTLDPKARLFHAPCDLAQLAAYARELLPQGLAKGVSTSELGRMRADQPGRSYDELRWLLALLRSGGRLGGKLDPGGSYEITEALRVDASFHDHGAIAAALARPSRLHEIVAASGASMEHVFDVVNAYDAIGRLRWTPRQRLAPDPRPESKPASRFRWPFGKR